MLYVYDLWYSDPLTREFVVVRHALTYSTKYLCKIASDL